MMYSPELSQALVNRHRRRASIKARKRSLTDQGVTSGPSGSGRSLLESTGGPRRPSISGRRSGGFDANGNDLDAAPVPLAVKYLEQVLLEMAVTKKHADVRYILTVRHSELNAAWRHARSFDEYRKLQQRLIKKLQHGHFCNADCPWLYGFLKSYFPKKLVFTFSSAKVVDSRKQTLERFFSALLGFLMDRKNHCCSVVMSEFADEVVEFIYGDALQQYGLENPEKCGPVSAAELLGERRSEGLLVRWDDPGTPRKLASLQQQRSGNNSSFTNSSFTGSVPEDDAVNDPNCSDCVICGSSLCGVAFGSSTSTSTLTSVSSASLSEDDSSRSGGSIASSGAAESKLPLSRSNSSNSNYISNTSGVFTPPWLGTLKTTGSRKCTNSFGNNRRSSSSASRRRASTYYLTTLSCGHQFHDECIVPKLNDSLKCPTCGRVQTNH
ncbi:hypothetical protein PHYBOEH_008400 [Phytophthora boehmeriae]|uniref:RING-type domain-containing protein n=1 Tax=Phytophthora boehmeriae TaxID=109152 RepID=A0A8T1X007_9STRA|nr:hypothetical protein PHYBOEH_008400 [Phytophthora boehmeriae]